MMSSVLGKIGAVNMSALSAAHGGVKLLAKAAACELGPEKIRINSIHPGLVDTYTDEEFKKNYPESLDSLKYEKDSIEMIPFQRKASCDEIAEAIRFLVSDQSPLFIAESMSQPKSLYKFLNILSLSLSIFYL